MLILSALCTRLQCNNIITLIIIEMCTSLLSESLKDLIRFLRRDDTTCEVRRQLGSSQVLQNVSDLWLLEPFGLDSLSQLAEVACRL